MDNSLYFTLFRLDTNAWNIGLNLTRSIALHPCSLTVILVK